MGEYVFSRTPDRSYETQIRFKQEGTQGSSNSAIAMNVNGDTVGFYALGATGGNSGVGLLTINDQEIPFSLTSKLSRDLPKGGRIDISGRSSLVAIATVTWPDGNAAVILLQPEAFSFVTLYVPPATQGTLQGLLGNADGDYRNEFKGRDGTAYPLNLSFEQLYKGFGDSWRVQPAESLFRYGAGQSTSTFTRLDFPPPPQPIAPQVLTQAEATCRAAGVTDAEAVKDCTFDVAVSQKPELAQSALLYDPNNPLLAISPANTAVGAGQQLQLRASVQGKANLADVQWTTTGGTLSANVDGVVTLSAPSTVGQLTVTATVAGAASTAVVAVRSSAITATSSASAFVGQSIPLRADLLGVLAGKPLVWRAARGSVTPSGNAVTYTAPATPGDDTVTVQMQGDPAVSATIPVQVLGAQISLSPAVMQARVGEVIGFNVTYGGFSQSTPTVDWSASGGTLTPGLSAARYTAPAQAGTYTVTASVQGRPELSTTARITVTDQKITLTPAAVNVDPGETHRFQADLSSFAFPPSLTWTTSGGTLVPDGSAATFTAPRQPGVYTVSASGASLQGTAQVTVPELKPSIDTTWGGGDGTAFPGMTVSLVGIGLRGERAVWTATAGTLSMASGTNGVTFTTPTQPGDVTLSYRHSLFPDVQASVKLSVQTPNLALSTTKDQFDVGEDIYMQVQGVPKYLCSRLKTNIGTVSNCYVSFTPTTGGPQTVTVNLDGIANTTASKTVQVSGLRLVADAMRVHGGLKLAIRALSTNGQPYSGSINWTATGGSVEAQASGSNFIAGAVPGTYLVTASPAGNPALNVSVPVEVYLDPISLATSDRGTIVGQNANLSATRPDGSVYPVPLDWQITGGTGSAGLGTYRFTTGPITGVFTQTVRVVGAPQLSASVMLTVIDLSFTLKLSNGQDVSYQRVLSNQTLPLPFQVTTSNGQPYTRPMNWYVYTTDSYLRSTYYTGTFSFVDINKAQLSVRSPQGILQVLACDQEFTLLCARTNLNVNPLVVTRTLVNPMPVGDFDGTLVGEASPYQYQVTGLSDFPTQVTWSWDDETRQVDLPTFIVPNPPTSYTVASGCGTTPGLFAIESDGYTSYTDHFLSVPDIQIKVNGVFVPPPVMAVAKRNNLIQAQFTCNPQYPSPRYIDIRPNDTVTVTMLLPGHRTAPQFDWSFKDAALAGSGRTMTFQAPSAPGEYTLRSAMVQYPDVFSEVVFQVTP